MNKDLIQLKTNLILNGIQYVIKLSNQLNISLYKHLFHIYIKIKIL